MLVEELNKLDAEQLGRIAEIWGAPKVPKDKKAIINLLKKVSVDEYFLKGVLEKLTPVQVKIYALLVANRGTLTLGEVSRRVQLQPINVEKELAVLKHLMLVYQRKNRERITSNLDKYYPFDEIKKVVSVDTNHKGEKFQISIKKELGQKNIELDNKYKTAVGKTLKGKAFIDSATADKTFAKIIKGLGEGELKLVDEAFSNGGILEIHAARITCDEQKLAVEKTLRKLHEMFVLRDIYFIDDRFVRVLVLPIEIFNYLKTNPIFLKSEGVKELGERTICNQLDFILNIKKLLLFISNKGLTLAQSEKIKQADMKKSESSLLEMDLRLFMEKSQVHQIEIILPFLKIFHLIDLRGENIVLKENYEEFLKREPLGLLKDLIEETAISAEKRMVGNEVFLPIDIPFYRRNILDRIVQVVSSTKGIFTKVLVAELIREWVILSPGFRVRNFKTSYLEFRGSIVSAMFYMHIFGLLEVEYPRRFIRLSELGRHYFFGEDITSENSAGAVIINPDASLVAMDDKLSIFGVHLLKSFTDLKEFDRVYHFQITKDSLQTGLLLGNQVNQFLEFLQEVSKNKIPQNLMFLISDWSEDLPIVTIEEGVVLLETSDAKLTELLLGQIKGKKIVRKELSPTALIINKNRIQEVMDVAEKLEMIVKLVR